MLATNLSNRRSVNWVIQLPEVNTAKLPTPKLSVMVKFERVSGLWNYRLSRPTATFFLTFFDVFFSKSKKHDFLRFFELSHTFSRTLPILLGYVLHVSPQPTLLKHAGPVGHSEVKNAVDIGTYGWITARGDLTETQPTWCAAFRARGKLSHSKWLTKIAAYRKTSN